MLAIDENNIHNVCRNISLKIYVQIAQTYNITILDLISIIDSDTIHIDRELSDHDGTYLTIDCGFSNNKNYKRKIWHYKLADYLPMKQKILKQIRSI
jgi:hypothetical protein